MLHTSLHGQRLLPILAVCVETSARKHHYSTNVARRCRDPRGRYPNCFSFDSSCCVLGDSEACSTGSVHAGTTCPGPSRFRAAGRTTCKCSRSGTPGSSVSSRAPPQTRGVSNFKHSEPPGGSHLPLDPSYSGFLETEFPKRSNWLSMNACVVPLYSELNDSARQSLLSQTCCI